MKTSDLTISILVDEAPEQAFDAINNVRGWWTGEPGIEGSTDKLGDEFTYRQKDIHYSKQKVTESLPGKKVVWLVTDSKLNFIKNKSEWTGTKIIFEISEKNNKTQIRFTHMGLVPDSECYNDVSSAWNFYINSGLRDLIAKNKVQPQTS